MEILDEERLQFQLHHTGIKTLDSVWRDTLTRYFNCTIQELKREDQYVVTAWELYFNCTIQELKLMELSARAAQAEISIAPYRN